MDAERRREVLARYHEHAADFRRLAARVREPAPTRPALPPPPLASPTVRETEVLQLAADGLVNREIGTRLTISEETVKSHVRSVLAKLEAVSRAHAVAIGLREGLIS